MKSLMGVLNRIIWNSTNEYLYHKYLYHMISSNNVSYINVTRDPKRHSEKNRIYHLNLLMIMSHNYKFIYRMFSYMFNVP